MALVIGAAVVAVRVYPGRLFSVKGVQMAEVVRISEHGLTVTFMPYECTRLAKVLNSVTGGGESEANYLVTLASLFWIAGEIGELPGCDLHPGRPGRGPGAI